MDLSKFNLMKLNLPSFDHHKVDSNQIGFTDKWIKAGKRRAFLKGLKYVVGVILTLIVIYLAYRNNQINQQSNTKGETINDLQQQVIEQGKLINNQQRQLDEFRKQLGGITTQPDTIK